MPVQTKIQMRRGTAAAWAAANPVLSAGEPGFDTTNNTLKIGDGVLAWLSLPVFSFSAIQGAALPAVNGYLAPSPPMVLNVGIPAEGDLLLLPFDIARVATFDQIMCRISTVGAAGALIRLGIYVDDGAGNPGALSLDAGTLVGDGTTGLKAITISKQLVPGRYYMGGVVQGAAAVRPTTYLTTTQMGMQRHGTVGPDDLARGFRQASVSGALPDPFTGAIANVNTIRTFLRRSA